MSMTTMSNTTRSLRWVGVVLANLHLATSSLSSLSSVRTVKGPSALALFVTRHPRRLHSVQWQLSLSSEKTSTPTATTIPPDPSFSDMEDTAAKNVDGGTAAAATATTTGTAAAPLPLDMRGKVNEIDFCMAPSDVSLSRAYLAAAAESQEASSSPPPQSSLTRALNSASNRAVRRILLSRSWPSAEALNKSLRQVLIDGKGRPQDDEATHKQEETTSPKCPVPRPILNILVQRRDESRTSEMRTWKRGRSDEEWVHDQMTAFRANYGTTPGYEFADAYLECVLVLATKGEESTRLSEVMNGGVYDESYRRLLSALQTGGVVMEDLPAATDGRQRIASKLVENDICLSVLDQIAMGREQNKGSLETTNTVSSPLVTNDATTVVATTTNVPTTNGKRERFQRFKFWKRGRKDSNDDDDDDDDDEEEEEDNIKPEDLGAVLLSAEEPTMTRQLNSLSNVVQRTLLFGSDQELLVLMETLEADRRAFVQRWYPPPPPDAGACPGVAYFDSLVQLLRDCYSTGVVTTLLPSSHTLSTSYANAYERLTRSLVEMGSGYIRPMASTQEIMANTPRTANEEFGRFAKLESSIRKNAPDVSAYPTDLVGTWTVRDEIRGQVIGSSVVKFEPQGQVSVAPPLQGLRWRLDPGPTHLDTCTFQVLGDDGAVLQYKGFVDRGARLEARFSKRSICIRGSVTFMMRDGGDASSSLGPMGEDYWRDMLPVNYKTVTTKFSMMRRDEEEAEEEEKS